jgi:hypothetical protein
LKALAEIIISFFELAEAEGRELRRNVLVLLAAAAIFFAAAVMAIAGTLALLFALYRLISPSFGEIISLAATGAVSVLLSIAAGATMFRHINKNLVGKDMEDDQPDNRAPKEGDVPGGCEGEPAAVDGERQPGGND